MPDDNKGTPLSEDQNPNPGNEESNIPDWMKEAGWEKDSGTFDESKPIFENIDDEDDTIVPADIPAWLEDAAPDGFNVDPNATPAFEGINDEEPFITTGDLIPRFPMEGASAPVETTSTDPIPTEPTFAEPTPYEPTSTEPATDEDDKPEKTESELDIPSWLENLKLDEDSQETAVTWLENMPENLRATEEEIAASLVPKTDSMDVPVDELAWIDEIANKPDQEKKPVDISTAALSEDLVASDLIPEQGEEEQIFAEEEIQSVENIAPDWLQELGEKESQSTTIPADETIDEMPVSADPPAPVPSATSDSDDVDLMPDWLSDLETDEPAPETTSSQEPVSEQSSEDSSDIPDWLGDFESGVSDPEDDPSSLDWLDNLPEKPAEPVAEITPVPPSEDKIDPDPEEQIPEFKSYLDDDVSPNDETLNTQVPDWLANIGETEIDGEEKEFGASASWLDEIDKPIEGEPDSDGAPADGEVLNWLENMDDQAEEPTPIDDLRESLAGDLIEEHKPIELETARYLPKEDESSESLPDWLSELAGDDSEESTSLESAIRQSDHSLSSEEMEYLEQAEEVHDENSDWLAKLDLTSDEAPPETETPAIKVDLPEEPQSLEPTQTIDPDEDEDEISGGILDRLKEPSEPQAPEVPQWLENLKKEEDPQETAILWLKQFVERGNGADLQDEIKRYTDELNPGDTVPKWMEDLKHEEDPQTTAMLWLEKLAGERPAPEPPKPPKPEVEASWLSELEKEVTEQSSESPQEPEKDFQDTSDGWLADLEIDEKLKSEEPDIPDWSDTPAKESQEGDTPMWMKATSPLEGDFHTDELAGSADKEVEIPAWLAGYGEGEEPEEGVIAEPVEPADEAAEQDEYAWVSESGKPSPAKPSKDPIDLNKAAISQLESILGISYQVAQGIVIYREKQGPFKELVDLLKVPEITDEQTIEILKPEVFIQAVEEKPKPAPKAAVKVTPIDERLQLAKALLAESQIPEALEHYSFLIKKKKSVPQVIEDLIQATADHPTDISILKVLGDAYMRIDKLDDALKSYTKAENLLR